MYSTFGLSPENLAKLCSSSKVPQLSAVVTLFYSTVINVVTGIGLTPGGIFGAHWGHKKTHKRVRAQVSLVCRRECRDLF